MRSTLPKARLGSFLRHRNEFFTLDDTVRYKRVRVQLHNKGIVLRDIVDGAELRTKKQQAARTSDLLVAEIDAKVGGFGIVPPELDGAIVSSHYFLYDIDETKCPRGWLDAFIRSGGMEEQVKARGSTNYAAIRPEHILDFEIPLPALAEQRRIVTWIKELATKIEEARRLRWQATQGAAALFGSAINDVWSDESNWTVRPVGELAVIVSGQTDPRTEPYASLPHINGEAIESSTCRLLAYRVAKDDGVTSGKFHFRAGSVLYSKIRPYLKKAVQVPFEGICSADIYAFESIDPVLEPRFFMYSLVAPGFTEYANSLSGRTRMPKLNQKQLLAFKISYPSLSEQCRVVAYLDNLRSKIDALKHLQAETAGELDALLPSILDKAFKGEL